MTSRVAPAADYLPLMEVDRFARNGALCQSSAFVRAAEELNRALVYGTRKLVYSNLPDARFYTFSSSAGAVNVARFAFKSSVGAQYLRAIIDCGPADPVLATNPYIDMTIDDGTPVTSDPLYVGKINSTYVNADDQNRAFAVTQIQMAIDENTLYECYITKHDYARPIAIIVFETSDRVLDLSANGVDPNAYDAGAPVLIGDLTALAQGINNVLYYNPSHVLSWSLDSPSGGRADTSYTNQISYVTSVAKSAGSYTAGWKVDFGRWARKGRSTVNVRMGVYGKVSAGATCTARLATTSGTLVSLNLTNTSYDWIYTSAAISAAVTEFDFQALTNMGTYYIDALALWIDP